MCSGLLHPFSSLANHSKWSLRSVNDVHTSWIHTICMCLCKEFYAVKNTVNYTALNINGNNLCFEIPLIANNQQYLLIQIHATTQWSELKQKAIFNSDTLFSNSLNFNSTKFSTAVSNNFLFLVFPCSISHSAHVSKAMNRNLFA